MNLDEAQRSKLTEWVGQGLKLSEIQNRLASELGVRLTYMEVRLLVDDLKLTLKDAEPPKAAAAVLPGESKANTGQAPGAAMRPPAASQEPRPPGGVSVSVDQIAKPGTVVSGKVTFSDGVRADWYFDQTGRLGLVSPKPGYRPPASDMTEFQAALDEELTRMGY
ncbi:MAG TPA: hypothetical protein PKX23_00975 [Verrucomicrobiota bacterium]|nr:hypothetical protein [Verrucomicrobiota bacterium]